MRYRFSFRAIPFIATVLVVALGISLGQWQERRAAEKIALQAKLSARGADAPLVLTAGPKNAAELEFRTVSVAGEFVPDWPLFLDNRPQDGKVGFYLLMPFKLAGSNEHILVARGWLPRYNAEHDRLPEFGTPAGTVIVTGSVRSSMGKVMQLGTPAPLAPKAILQNVTPEQFGAASKLAVQPFFIEQTVPSTPADTMVRNWPAPALGVERHQGYAFQWYALAVMALLFFVFTGFRRGTK
ncbi:MAG: SURF1 family protein [Massilia sp.]